MHTSELAEIDDLQHLFVNDIPLLDVRAPVEFAEGAFPCAENHPLIDNVERHEIGIAYKENGQDNAIALGERLVSGEIKSQRITTWHDFLKRHPNAVLYCFRGGMRSKISQRWLLEHVGITCPRVRGGYKAMRRYLLDQIEQNSAACQPLVIGGRTGVGKTRLLLQCDTNIDLEALANHRGSAFGHHPLPQPAQIDFENALSVALLKRVKSGNRPFVVEDESRNIGSRHLPPTFFQCLQNAPLILLEANEEERIDVTLDEYVHDSLAAFQQIAGEDQGFYDWAAYLQDALNRIRKRLGGDRYTRAQHLLHAALEHHEKTGDTSDHRNWIDYLLREYYDGMYEYQLENKRQRIIFTGSKHEVFDYLRQYHSIERKTA